MLKNKKYLAKGKRSIVYRGFFKNKEAVMKVVNNTAPLGVIRNEAKWLKRLEKYRIGPKLYEESENYIICERVKGKKIMDWIESNKKYQIKKVLKQILKQCRTLDEMRVNKKELQRPVKHIIIGKKARMIDFERCKETNKPKNVTQFCQFLTSNNMKKLLEDKEIYVNKEKLIKLLKDYKKEQNDKNFEKILNCFN